MTAESRDNLTDPATPAAPPASSAARPELLAASRRGAARLRNCRSTRAVAYQIIVAASANPAG